MNYTPEKITSTQIANIQMLQDLATNAYAGLEDLIWLNLASSKASFAEACERVQTLLDAKDAQEWLALQAMMWHPPTNQYAHHFQRLFDVVFGLHSGFAKNLDILLANFNRAMNMGDSTIARAQSSSKKAIKVIEVE